MKSIKSIKHHYSTYIIFFIWILLLPAFVIAQSAESGWPDELNTTRDSPYLNELERNIILELNKVRSNPKQFAEEYMEKLRTAYIGKLYTYPGQNPVRSQEGIRPLLECIQVLKQTEPMPILQPSEGLAKAATLLLADQQQNGGIGHITRDGLTPKKRIEKFGEWDICSAEDITYGSFEARQIVIALLIDDGVPSRDHRKNILNQCFHYAGVANGTHSDYLSMCVIDYAGDYITK